MARNTVGFNTGASPLSRMKAQPIPVPRSLRAQDVRVISSFMPGKMVPLAVMGLFREDRVRYSRYRLSFEMMETAEVLMQAVNVNVKAYLVPNLAFDRFDGIDQLNRSYQKEPKETGGSTVIPYIQTMTMPAHGASEILTKMGIHAKPGTVVNAAYIEAYNKIWNFRAANRSPDITPRSLTDQTLAKAFWQHTQFNAVVPDFDQAAIDGEVPLNIIGGHLPIKKSGGAAIGDEKAVTNNLFPNFWSGSGMAGGARTLGFKTGAGNPLYYSGPNLAGDTIPLSFASESGLKTALTGIYAELAENGITVSLSNIELARKTQAFALLRKQYNAIPDEYIIDMLMNGLSVPEQAWRQPILLADRSTIFGMSKRYSTTADDLTASVANGATFIDLSFGTPVVPTGGYVVIVCEVTPEQLFERQSDPFFMTVDQENYPEFLRDTLDPEKVEIVQNGQIDVDHTTPTATFGYAPLNWKFTNRGPGVGGKFYRPLVDEPIDEDRMRIWACETPNPTLSEDFYLCTNLNTKPFVVTNQDPFEVVLRGVAQIEGNTVFGRMLIEASDDYEEIMSEAPTDRIDKPVSLDAEDTPSVDAAEEVEK